MLCSVREVQTAAVDANDDGRIGSIEAMLFDDVSWIIRYLVVDTGSWLPGRRVLISPISVDPSDGGERVRVRLPP